MKKYYFICILVALISCDDNQGTIPGRIKHDTRLDTVHKDDSVKVNQDLVLPEDNTDVIDTNETHLMR